MKKLWVLVSLMLSACASEPLPPSVKFSGEPVTFPITFVSSVAYGGAEAAGLQMFVNHAHNTPITCEYTFGNEESGYKKGRFTTPATLELEFTDKEKAIALDCSFRGSFRGREFTGFQPWVALTDFSRHERSFTYGGTFGDKRTVRFPYNRKLGAQRAALIETRGVQILPQLIALGLRVKPVE